MKAYVVITGVVFGLPVVGHVWRGIENDLIFGNEIDDARTERRSECLQATTEGGEAAGDDPAL
jgi:hypothetical protein